MTHSPSTPRSPTRSKVYSPSDLFGAEYALPSRSDALFEKGTPIYQDPDRPITMYELIREEFSNLLSYYRFQQLTQHDTFLVERVGSSAAHSPKIMSHSEVFGTNADRSLKNLLTEDEHDEESDLDDSRNGTSPNKLSPTECIRILLGDSCDVDEFLSQFLENDSHPDTENDLGVLLQRLASTGGFIYDPKYYNTLVSKTSKGSVRGSKPPTFQKVFEVSEEHLQMENLPKEQLEEVKKSLRLLIALAEYALSRAKSKEGSNILKVWNYNQKFSPRNKDPCMLRWPANTTYTFPFLMSRALQARVKAEQGEQRVRQAEIRYHSRKRKKTPDGGHPRKKRKRCDEDHGQARDESSSSKSSFIVKLRVSEEERDSSPPAQEATEPIDEECLCVSPVSPVDYEGAIDLEAFLGEDSDEEDVEHVQVPVAKTPGEETQIKPTLPPKSSMDHTNLSKQQPLGNSGGESVTEEEKQQETTPPQTPHYESRLKYVKSKLGGADFEPLLPPGYPSVSIKSVMKERPR